MRGDAAPVVRFRSVPVVHGPTTLPFGHGGGMTTCLESRRNTRCGDLPLEPIAGFELPIMAQRKTEWSTADQGAVGNGWPQAGVLTAQRTQDGACPLIVADLLIIECRGSHGQSILEDLAAFKPWPTWIASLRQNPR